MTELLETRRTDAILERLMRLHPKVIDLTLDRVYRLLEALGNPQDRLPPVVHVAGTNGKGSTIAFLKAILTEAGYRPHVYTSPHLVRFAERIALGGAQIAEPDLASYLERCEEANGGAPITYFEITTCAALLAFAENPADIVLLEVGLGGRLDATNVIGEPVCTAITPVSMDHMQFLGNTLAAIAGEKAAIQKPDIPSIVAPQQPEAMRVIEDTAREAGAPMTRAQPVADDRPLGLAGDHQRINAGVAAEVVSVLRRAGFAISEDAVAAGFAKAHWRARLQKLQTGPVLDVLGSDWEVWLDGGHNAAAGEIIATYARRRWDDRPLHLIVGMLNTKAVGDFLRPLASLTQSAQAIPIPGEPNSLSAEELCAIAQAEGIDSSEATGLEAAAVSLAATGAAPGRLLICGSLYLSGEVLATHA